MGCIFPVEHQQPLRGRPRAYGRKFLLSWRPPAAAFGAAVLVAVLTAIAASTTSAASAAAFSAGRAAGSGEDVRWQMAADAEEDVGQSAAVMDLAWEGDVALDGVGFAFLRYA